MFIDLQLQLTKFRYKGNDDDHVDDGSIQIAGEKISKESECHKMVIFSSI